MKIIRTITFLFRDSKLKILKSTLSGQMGWVGHEVHTVIVSNVPSNFKGRDLLEEIDPLGLHHIQWYHALNISDPWLLTWEHKPIHKSYYNDGFDFFIHTEEDILIHKFNIDYWLEHRIELKEIDCYPILLRVEMKEYEWYFTDVLKQITAESCVYKSKSLDFRYYTLTNPYQAAFLYDRDLMQEHISDDSFILSKSFDLTKINANPKHPGGGVAEAAVSALTHTRRTGGITSRALVPLLFHFRVLDKRCLTHHLSNSYTTSNEGFCSISIDQIFAYSSL